MFKQAIIYYPSDPKTLGEIHREIATLHCVAITNYLESLGFDDRQKGIVIYNLLKEIKENQHPK